MGNMEDEEGAKKVVGEKTKKVRGGCEEGARKVRGRCEGHWKRMGINTLVPTQAGNSGRCSEDVCIGACRQRYPKAAGIFKLQGHREPAAAAVWAVGK